MPIPKSRRELLDMVASTWAKLDKELESAPDGVGDLQCVDDWTVRELLAVRAWWTESVVDWIRAGGRGEELDLPAPGYSWQETPRLNADIVADAEEQSYEEILGRLRSGQRAVLELIDDLDDEELLEPGTFEWAGKWPIARWISLNTARQYTTARTFVRKALREAADGQLEAAEGRGGRRT